MLQRRSLILLCLGPLQPCVLMTDFLNGGDQTGVGITVLALARWVCGYADVILFFCNLHELN